MIEIEGNLWDYQGKAPLVITTGGQVNRRGEALLLRGCARQAREREPSIASTLGRLLRQQGNHVHNLGAGLISFPVEETPMDLPDLTLIRQSCQELVALTNREQWPLVIVPRPGCGSGGLEWAQVRPILTRLLDDRFHVIHPAP